MKTFEIYAGLGGGFGGPEYQITEEFECESDAEEYACQLAQDVYYSYEGLHGILDIEEIMECNECSEEDAYEIQKYDIDSWIEYYVTEV